MGVLNNHKLVNNISMNYFERLNVDLDLKVSNKTEAQRIGFYLFALSCITGITDIEDLKELVTDTEFQKKVCRKGNNDLGIDACFIDEDKKEINLFNFKFRERLKDAQQQMTMLTESTKFLNAVYSGNTECMDEVTKQFADVIIEKQSSSDIWNMKLFLVSNESKKIDVTSNEVKSFKENYSIEIFPVVLEDIIEFTSGRPENKKATFVIDSDAVLTYKENKLS